jgi:uncharacterized RDD family membrane protein YckC
MKCPYCGYNSFDHLEYCKKCDSPLSADPGYWVSHQGGTGDNKESSHTRSKGDPGESTGELFGEGTLPAEGTASPRRSYRFKVSGRKRTGTARNTPEDEPYELFPVSKGVESGTSSKRRRSDPPQGAKIKEPKTEEELSDVGPDDPFMFAEHGRTPRERGSAKDTESADERESDIYNLAGFISRAMAMIIDMLLVSLIAFLAATTGLYLANGFALEGFGSENIFIPVYLALFFLASTYFVFLHGYGGKTVGKILMGIRLINNEGERVGFGEAFIRWLGYYISAAFLFAGFLWALVDSECQTWHDKLSGTYVVKDEYSDAAS